MTPAEHKTYENRLRRVAERQGLVLAKSRRRDPRAADFGNYYLIRAGVRVLVATSLKDVEQFLT